jgi:hypothetical protein
VADSRIGPATRRALAIFRRVSFEQKVAAVGSLLLIVSTFGPFSFVEAAEIVVAVAVLTLVAARGEGREFHLPFGDGTVIMAAGIWAALLIVVRLFDRPLGQNLLALACAAILGVAGAAERAKRPPDDLPDEAPTPAAAPRTHDPSRTETAVLPRGEPPPTDRPDSPPS